MPKGTCTIDGCEKSVRCRGLCKNHYDRLLKHGDPLGGGPDHQPPPDDGMCTIDGCENEHYARGWCNKHYLRWRHHGDPLAVLPPSGGHAPYEVVGYEGLHSRVEKERGPAASYACAHADETCKGIMQWANISQEYRDVNDFMPLCKSHHRWYDCPGLVPGQRKAWYGPSEM